MEVSKLEGVLEALADTRIDYRRSWNATTAHSFALFDHDPTLAELNAASFVTTHTFSATDTDFNYVVLNVQLDTQDVRDVRARLADGAIVYLF